MKELVAEVLRSGEEDAILDEIMMTYGQDILQLVYSYVKNLPLAEDLTQEIFVKCYQALPRYRGEAKIRTWLWRIAINHCKDYLKSWYYRQVELNTGNYANCQAVDHVEQDIIQKDEDKVLSDAVMNLPVKYREVIYLYYFQELTIKEMAEMTGNSQSTIKTRMRRAKHILKNSLEGTAWKID
ncbi:sigma-70 family RNA polymerase sigma factor [Peribacillus huizhouensis]|uniref:RNA polymerase sigma-70 factor (ECF subfamily) n=1 Tax=Peribacillus huizhouensis TaxID=1501239 RepID=A0ABR6CL53_9BACI|nr:sigma-70 family RNA polymerase sigma factor [Peribacillus huizhouensis]MBA9025778.1 RNA polymerase sigma-70 factor (ECF subfamily) [Peribacillus huizhouensis]